MLNIGCFTHQISTYITQFRCEQIETRINAEEHQLKAKTKKSKDVQN